MPIIRNQQKNAGTLTVRKLINQFRWLAIKLSKNVKWKKLHAFYKNPYYKNWEARNSQKKWEYHNNDPRLKLFYKNVYKKKLSDYQNLFSIVYRYLITYKFLKTMLVILSTKISFSSQE